MATTIRSEFDLKFAAGNVLRFRVTSPNPSDSHVRLSVFVGKHGQTFANAGMITLRTEEWLALSTGYETPI